MGKKNLGTIDGDEALHDLAKSFPSTKNTSVKPDETNTKPEHPLTVRIPMYVAHGIRRAYADTGKPQRLIVLEALKAWGIPVKDEDLVQKRRSKEG